MQVLNIEPKDIHVTIDLSIREIKMLLKALDRVKIDYDGKKEPDMIEAAGFLKLFFKFLSEVEEEIGPPKRNAA